MNISRNRTLLLLASLNAALIFGCSNPTAEFENVCLRNSGDAEFCTCMINRLAGVLTDSEIRKLTQAMRSRPSSLEDIRASVDGKTYRAVFSASFNCA